MEVFCDDGSGTLFPTSAGTDSPLGLSSKGLLRVARDSANEREVLDLLGMDQNERHLARVHRDRQIEARLQEQSNKAQECEKIFREVMQNLRGAPPAVYVFRVVSVVSRFYFCQDWATKRNGWVGSRIFRSRVSIDTYSMQIMIFLDNVVLVLLKKVSSFWFPREDQHLRSDHVFDQHSTTLCAEGIWMGREVHPRRCYVYNVGRSRCVVCKVTKCCIVVLASMQSGTISAKNMSRSPIGYSVFGRSKGRVLG